MPSLANVFARVSGGKPTVSASDAQKAILKAGNFGMFSITGKMMKSGIEHAIEKADANQDGLLDVNEFHTAVAAISGKLPAWDTFAQNKTSLTPQDVAALVTATAKSRGGALGGMVDADGVARITVSLLDDDGDGQVSRAEYDQLRSDATS